MTPAARIASAITILDDIIAGSAAEKALTNWARANRYAGSGDRAAVRDHVYDALRCRRSFGSLGGSDSGRGLMIGAVRTSGGALETLFSGEGYGAAPLTDAEKDFSISSEMTDAEKLDCPDWLYRDLKCSLGKDFNAVLSCLQSRAPLYLRVNTRAGSRKSALQALAKDDIGAKLHDLSPNAILVTEFPRRVRNSAVYRTGAVEIQDAASQAVVDLLPLQDGAKILDFCAGGGGKSLAMAAAADLNLFAHDADPQRMRDLPARANRANVTVEIVATTDDLAPRSFDLVLCDVPCSGSGAWRRSPDAKWKLTQDKLDRLCQTQSDILTTATGYVNAAGILAYATCSLLDQENAHQIAGFLKNNPDWRLMSQKCFTPLDGGDGFYIALLTRV